MNIKRIFQTRITGRACENFGAVDYTITDTIYERNGGIHVVTTARGMCEGTRVDERSERFYEDGTMEKAAAYRLSNGYTEIGGS